MIGNFQLGYLCLEVRDLAAFSAFLTDVVGFMPNGEADGWTRFRIDGAAARLFCRQGPADDIVASGWDFGDLAALSAAAERLTAAGAAVTWDPDGLAAARSVNRLASTRDFHGTGVEIFIGQHQASDPVVLPHVRHGFLTGDGLGLGHFVLLSRDKARDLAFYRDALGLRWSDDIVMQLGPIGLLEASFLHANPRHHSVAVGQLPAPVPMRSRLDHICFEMRGMDDVGYAHGRFVAVDLPIVRDFGMHPNDQAFSFYGRSPAPFDVEIAYGGITIAEEEWIPQTYDHITKWGHRAPSGGVQIGG